MGTNALAGHSSQAQASPGREREALRRGKLSADSGQASVEWIGLVLLVAVLIAALVFGLGAAGRLPGAALAQAIATKLVCAVHLGGDCGNSPIDAAYGAEVAALVERHVPVIRYERGMRALPVDYRRCRQDSCAEGAESGSIWRSQTGEPVAAFTHVVDCRADAEFSAEAAGPDCSGRRAGKLYLQFWFYYPGSATAEGSIPGVKDGIRWASTKLGKPSFHPDDWESLQIRIGPDAEVLSRASSHQGHVYSGSVSDVVRGKESGTRNSEAAAATIQAGSWGPSTGFLYVAGGSHAGRVGTTEPTVRITPGSQITLIPLEQIEDRARYRFAVTPPWLKKLWRDPEAESTD
jgi:hypothetical protein